jgi:hypothetical protein
MSTVKHREEEVYAAVAAGELVIDSEGRCWRVAFRQGNRWNAQNQKGETRLIVCPPRRAEDILKSGHLRVRVMIAGKRWHVAAHRLVYRHFNGPIPTTGKIRHVNKVIDDNRPSNLVLSGSRRKPK